MTDTADQIHELLKPHWPDRPIAKATPEYDVGSSDSAWAEAWETASAPPTREPLRPLNTYQFHDQLPMFMTGREIKENYKPWYGDINPGETESGLWNRKYREATHVDMGPPSLRDDILKNGVKNPISLQFKHLYGNDVPPQVMGGHHRVAVMAQDKPDSLMPVAHYPDITSAWHDLGRDY